MSTQPSGPPIDPFHDPKKDPQPAFDAPVEPTPKEEEVEGETA